MRDKTNLLIIGTITFIITIFSTYEPISDYSGGGIGLLFQGLIFFSLATALNIYFHDKKGVGRNEAAFFAALAGLLIEMHQYLLPYKTFALVDVMAKSLGASIILFDQRLRLTERVLQLEGKPQKAPSRQF